MCCNTRVQFDGVSFRTAICRYEGKDRGTSEHSLKRIIIWLYDVKGVLWSTQRFIKIIGTEDIP